MTKSEREHEKALKTSLLECMRNFRAERRSWGKGKRLRL